MDVIPSAALNQYLITDTEERLRVCVSVCMCLFNRQGGERRRESQTGFKVEMGSGRRCQMLHV